MRRAFLVLTALAGAAYAGWWLGPTAGWEVFTAAKGYDGNSYEEDTQRGLDWGAAAGWDVGNLSTTAFILYAPRYDTPLLFHYGTWGETYWTEEGTPGFDARLRGRRSFGEGWLAPTVGGVMEWRRRRGDALERYFGWMDRGDEPLVAASWAANDFFVAPAVGLAGASGRFTWDASAAFGWRTRRDAGSTAQRRYYENGYIEKEVVPYHAAADAGTAAADVTLGVTLARRFRVVLWAAGRADLFASDNTYGKPDEPKDLAIGITPAWVF